MFRHCVLFRFKPDTPAPVIAEIERQLGALADLPMVQGFRCGADAGLAEGNFDFAVVADFADAAGYQAYATDPLHLQILTDHVRPNISERAAVQYAVQN